MELINSIVTRANPNGDCSQLSAACPPSESVYGYRPSLAATVFFLVLFLFSGAVYTYQGIRYKTWFFLGAMLLGSVSEAMGYVAKVLLWQNPFSNTGFKMSVVLLTFAPAFYAAGIYYTLKHICLTFGSSFSRLRPALYTIIFISCDVFSIMLQAVGGALASAANVADGFGLLDAGDNIMITGLATQTFTLVIFGLFAADYAFAVYRNRNRLNPATVELRNSLTFKLFLVALTVAYTCILIRCAYRVAELCGGWGSQNHIMRTQALFIGLDSVPCAIAAVALNIWHPGFCFPKEQQDVTAKEEKLASSSDEEQV